VIIRDFTKEDIDDVIECARESFVEEFEVEGFDPENWRRLVRWRFSVLGKMVFVFFRLFNREPMKFFVADADGKAVGTTIVTGLRNAGYIQAVMVRPEFRRKGVASELLSVAIKYIRKKGFSKAILHVASNNEPAKNLYQKLGFKEFDHTVYLTADLDSSIGFEGGGEKIQIQELQESDVDAAYEVIKRSRDPNVFAVYDFLKSDLKRSFWERIARMSTAKKLVAVRNGETLGYASCSCTTDKEAGRVRNIDVSPDVSLQGIEEELVRAGAGFIRSCGTKTVLVTVSLAKERLISKLEELGFRQRFFTDAMILEQL
jgi:ribosomal protein S18 acetylase RimI-like enzyme